MAKQPMKVGVEIKKGPRLELGFSPQTNTIVLAKMKEMGNGIRQRVGNDRGRDVTNEAAQLVWKLVMAEKGEIHWDLEDGTRMVLEAKRVPIPQELPEPGETAVCPRCNKTIDLSIRDGQHYCHKPDGE